MGPKIGFAGAVCYDIHYAVESYPREGTLSTVRSSTVKIGGMGNIMGQMAKLAPSAPLVYFGPLGRDAKGEYARDLFSRLFPNLDLSRVVTIDENAYTLIFDSEETKERTFFNKPVRGSDCGSADFDFSGSGCTHLVVNYLLESGWLDCPDSETGVNAATILRNARREGMHTYLDLCSRPSPKGRELCKVAFRYADTCVINEIEAQVATGIMVREEGKPADPAKVRAALEKMAGMGISTWAGIHTSEEGFLLDVRSGKIWRQPALRLPPSLVVSKTGAGDAFMAGIVYGSSRGWEAPEALKLATATAASSLAGSDGYETVKPAEETLAFFAKHAHGTRPEIL